jgi:hypothetical protein
MMLYIVIQLLCFCTLLVIAIINLNNFSDTGFCLSSVWPNRYSYSLSLDTSTKVKVKVILWLTVSWPVRLGVRHPSRTHNQFFLLLEMFFRQLQVCYFVASSLMRGWVCNLLNMKHINQTQQKPSVGVKTNIKKFHTQGLAAMAMHNLTPRVCNIRVVKKLNSVVCIRKRTIPTESPPLVGEVSANFCG